MEQSILKPVQIIAAKAMLANHMNWREIGDCFGVHPETVRRAIDQQYRVRRAEQKAQRKAERRMLEKEGVDRASAGWCMDRRQVRSDVEARMAEIPRDTRDLTARVCGDPLPGRSALDRRSVGEVR